MIDYIDKVMSIPSHSSESVIVNSNKDNDDNVSKISALKGWLAKSNVSSSSVTGKRMSKSARPGLPGKQQPAKPS